MADQDGSGDNCRLGSDLAGRPRALERYPPASRAPGFTTFRPPAKPPQPLRKLLNRRGGRLDLGQGRNVGRGPRGSGAHADIGVGSETPGDRDLQDRKRSPHDSLHGFYGAIILAHGERVAWRRKCGFTRKYSHAVSLLIMDCFKSVGRRFESYRGRNTWLRPGAPISRSVDRRRCSSHVG